MGNIHNFKTKRHAKQTHIQIQLPPRANANGLFSVSPRPFRSTGMGEWENFFKLAQTILSNWPMRDSVIKMTTQQHASSRASNKTAAVPPPWRPSRRHASSLIIDSTISANGSSLMKTGRAVSHRVRRRRPSAPAGVHGRVLLCVF